jgi:hypothetical protein
MNPWINKSKNSYIWSPQKFLFVSSFWKKKYLQISKLYFLLSFIFHENLCCYWFPNVLLEISFFAGAYQVFPFVLNILLWKRSMEKPQLNTINIFFFFSWSLLVMFIKGLYYTLFWNHPKHPNVETLMKILPYWFAKIGLTNDFNNCSCQLAVEFVKVK